MSPESLPSLVVRRDDAERQLQDRIARGEALRNRRIARDEDLVEVRAERKRWHDYNIDLLRKLFDTDTLSAKYAEPIVHAGFLYDNIELEARDFREDLDIHLNRLASIVERLPLYQEKLPGVPVGPPGAEIAGPSQDVFLVHGRDEAARQTVARFLETLDIRVKILDERASQGRTLIEKLEREAIGVGFVVVLLTPDDVGRLNQEDEPLNPRARQNVIFEWAWFSARLGRNHVCALYVRGVEMPSDYPVAYVEMDAGEGWKLKLAQELQAAGINFDLNRALGAQQ
jgi:hypothetical protein